MKKILAIWMLILGCWCTQAQTITLDSCRAMALRHQASLRKAQLEVDAAKETKKAAFTKYFPSISATAGYFQSKEYLIDLSTNDMNNSGAQLDVNGTINGNPINIGGSIVDEIAGNLNLDINATLKMLDHGMFANLILTQPIFAGGRIYNGNKLAKLGISVAELQLQMTKDEVIMNVDERYWLLLTLKSKQEALAQALTMIDTLQRDAEAAHDAGVLGKNDLLKVKLHRNQLTATQLQVNNGIELATQALQQYIGYDGAWDDIADLDLIERAPLPPTMEQLSATHRTETQLLNMKQQATVLQTRMTIGEALPQIAVGATYGANNLLTPGFNHNGMVFATMNVPLSAWWETAHQAKVQSIKQKQAEIETEDLTQMMQLQQQQAYNELTEALLLLKNQHQAVADAEENLQESRNYYQAGLATVSDYLEAQTLLQQTKMELATQRMNYHLKKLRWQQLINQ